MLNILVLGHRGMLGNAVINFFLQYPDKYRIRTISDRWGDENFNITLQSSDADFVINCIGAIPQKHSKQPSKYKDLNINLPIFLDTLNKKIIHPSTDCEFSGKISINKKYTKKSIRDAEDEYGKSKAYISQKIESEFKNTKIIRTSIIGHELNTHRSLLDWSLSATSPIKGYTDHYWNGVTTIQWARLCEFLIHNWDKMPILNQYGTEEINSKYNLLKIIFKVYNKNTVVKKFDTGTKVNKCLESDEKLPNIEYQLIELRKTYNK